MKVLVTGASGFLGRYVTRELINAGYKVKGAYHSPSKKTMVEELGAEPVSFSLEDENTYLTALENVDVVIHLAAYYTFTGKRELYYKLNVEATEKLARLAINKGVNRFIYCSSTEALGPVENPPADENAVPNPQNDYGKSKLEAEKRIISLRAKGLKYTIIRPSGLYGPGNVNDVSYWFITGYIKGGLPSKFVIGDGKTYVQFAHVKDVARGFKLALEKEESINETFVISEEKYYSYLEVYEILSELTGISPPHIKLNPSLAKFLLLFTEAYDKYIAKSGNIMYRRMIVDSVTKHRAYSIRKAKEKLGYNPTYDLRKGLYETIEWYRKNGYLDVKHRE